MGALNMLLEIEDNKKIIKECNELLRDNSCIYLLKKIKEKFEREKINFKNKDSKLKELRLKLEYLSVNVSNLKKELEEDEFMLYNKSGNNLKLIDSLQNKIKNKEKLIKELDNESLELLREEEILIIEKESLRSRLLELKNKFYTFKKSSNEKINKAKEDIKKAEINILNLKTHIPEELLKKYSEIASIKEPGVAKLENGICSGCKLGVSAVTMDHVNKGKNIVYCDNCGRILYYKDMKDLSLSK